MDEVCEDCDEMSDGESRAGSNTGTRTPRTH